jgi:4-hydroxy-3-polyprenylbenzoate decarboxylase
VVVGITGATGSIYGIRALELLARVGGIETHLVISGAAKRTILAETDFTVRDVAASATRTYDDRDIGATLASGSYATAGMLIAPCSVKTLGAIAYCHADTLISRAADVTLKERRPLVLLLRETPLHAGHIRAMLAATEAGAILLPPVPAFYNRPRTIEEIVDHSVGRALALLGVEQDVVREWQGTSSARADRAGRAVPDEDEPDGP